MTTRDPAALADDVDPRKAGFQINRIGGEAFATMKCSDLIAASDFIRTHACPTAPADWAVKAAEEIAELVDYPESDMPRVRRLIAALITKHAPGAMAKESA